MGATLEDAQALMPTWAVPEDGKADEAAVDGDVDDEGGAHAIVVDTLVWSWMWLMV